MKINSKHYILLILALFSVILSGFGYWFVYNSVINKAENYSDNLKLIAIEDDKKRHMDELSKIYSFTLSDRAKLSNFILIEERIVNFIESVESIGVDSSSNVTLSSINNDDLSSAEKGTFGHLKGHIEIKGSWENVMRAIISIENLPYNITVNNINLISSKDGAGLASGKITKTNQWNVSLDIDVLTMK